MDALLVLGPTASGKSGWALRHALTQGGEIICGDAVQLFYGLPLLTASPTEEERARIPHKLYGVMPGEAPLMDAARFRALCSEAIEAVQGVGRLPFVVGGTGFYLKSLMEGLAAIPNVPLDLRHAWFDAWQNVSADVLWGMLRDEDPEGAKKLKPRDRQRVMRALSVVRFTGKPLGFWQKRQQSKPVFRFKTVVINPPSAILAKRIEKRLNQMLVQGALEEVKTYATRYVGLGFGPGISNMPCLTTAEALVLRTKGLKDLVGKSFLNADFSWPGATQALGFIELLLVCLGGLKLDQAKEILLIRTLQYAKRQRTWLRHQVKADSHLEDAKEGWPF